MILNVLRAEQLCLRSTGDIALVAVEDLNFLDNGRVGIRWIQVIVGNEVQNQRRIR